MYKLHELFYVLDLTGTFVFAISGAVAARQQGLDIFGIIVSAFTVACGGGIIRDLCIGSIPPANLSNWYYLLASIIATLFAISLYSVVKKMSKPVLFFDAIGLSIFAVTGAQKSLAFGQNAQLAILLGIITAVGGGVIRDILLNRVPVIFQKEIYASAALVAASIVVFGNYYTDFSTEFISIVALVVCCSIRLLSLYFKWNLPSFPIDKHQ